MTAVDARLSRHEAEPSADAVGKDTPCDYFDASDYENTLCSRCGHLESHHRQPTERKETT